MDFIERFIGISPDGGNGSLEFLIVASIVLVIITWAVIVRNQLARLFSWWLENLGQRESGDRFDS